MALYGVTDKIAEELGVRIREDVWAAELTTFRGGGRAARVYEPADADALARFLMRSAEQGAADFYLLGGGSNTVMEDGEILLPAVLTRGAAEITKTAEDERGVFIRAECGAPLGKIISFGREHGAGGLEFLAGVPATAGGAVHMNAGAFGHEIADYIFEIERLTPDFAEIERIKKEEAAFGYRRGAAGAVLRADFFLPRMSAEESVRRAAEFLVGEHDFRSFCANPQMKKSTVRIVDSIEIQQKKDLLYLNFHGTGFLQNMVRILTGTLLEVGFGKRSAESVQEVLDAKDRKLAGYTAPPQGLCLMRVDY